MIIAFLKFNSITSFSSKCDNATAKGYSFAAHRFFYMVLYTLVEDLRLHCILHYKKKDEDHGFVVDNGVDDNIDSSK